MLERSGGVIMLGSEVKWGQRGMGRMNVNTHVLTHLLLEDQKRGKLERSVVLGSVLMGDPRVGQVNLDNSFGPLVLEELVNRQAGRQEYL